MVSIVFFAHKAAHNDVLAFRCLLGCLHSGSHNRFEELLCCAWHLWLGFKETAKAIHVSFEADLLVLLLCLLKQQRHPIQVVFEALILRLCPTQEVRTALKKPWMHLMVGTDARLQAFCW